MIYLKCCFNTFCLRLGEIDLLASLGALTEQAFVVTRRFPATNANRLFDWFVEFAGYGFNKSHAVAYAMVAYQTAYLKANYPQKLLGAMTADAR